MPEINISGFRKKIAELAPHLSRSQCNAAAKRIAYRMQNMTEEFDFFAELRILGIISDPTARDAIGNLEAA